MKFFSADGPLYKMISMLWELIKLSFFWLLCSLPVVTIGASTTAAFSVALKLAAKEEGYIARDFFGAFKKNFWKGTLLGIISMVVVYALYIYWQLADAIPDGSVLVFILGIIAVYVFGLSLIYAFPILARYETGVWRAIRNSFKLSMRFFGRTMLMLLIVAILVVIWLWNWTTIMFCSVFAPGLIMLTISTFVLVMFRIVDAGDDVEEDPKKRKYISIKKAPRRADGEHTPAAGSIDEIPDDAVLHPIVISPDGDEEEEERVVILPPEEEETE